MGLFTVEELREVISVKVLAGRSVALREATYSEHQHRFPVDSAR